MEITFSIDQIASVAQQVVNANPKKVILFYGEMGAGKTTFIKQLCKTIGITEATSSPTFSLVNEYQTTNNELGNSDLDTVELYISKYLAFWYAATLTVILLSGFLLSISNPNRISNGEVTSKTVEVGTDTIKSISDISWLILGQSVIRRPNAGPTALLA